MNFSFTISRKLSVGFGVLILAIIFNGVLTYKTLTETKEKNEKISKIYTPSKSYLKDLKTLVERSGNLVVSWLSEEKSTDPDKKELRRLRDNDYREIKQNLDVLISKWNKEDQDFIAEVRKSIDSLFDKQHEIMKVFKDPKSYYIPSSNLQKRYNLIQQFQSSDGKYAKRIKDISKKISKQIAKETRLANQYTEEMEDEFDKLQDYVTYLSLFLVIGGVMIAYFTSSSIVRPLSILKEKLLVLGQGKLPEKRENNTEDEIGQMSNALDKLIDGLKGTSDFARAIGQGDFKSKFQPLSSEDTLGNSLLIMRENLHKVSIEDNKRNWTTEGLAKFGEILRRNSDNVKELASSLVSELVQYLEANQGGVFVINNDDVSDQHLDLVGCYAWDRVKFLEQHIREGDGLVGQVWQEKSTLYVTDVPEDYVKIVSGLGTANPKCILIVPMIVNDEIFGVIEIASFSEFEDYQIKFVERVAETTASTISTVKVNQRTKHLLEQAQKATEKMRTHDEELRHNQVEMSMAQKELKAMIEEMQTKLHDTEFDRNQLKEENEILQNVLLKTSKELERFKKED